MKIDLSSREIITGFFRQQSKFWITFWLCFLCGVAYILLSTPRYEASGSLLVKFGHEASPDVAQQDSGIVELSQNDRREVMQSDLEILLSHDLILQLVTEFGAEKLHPGIIEQVAGKDSPVEATIESILKRDLSVKSNPQSNIIMVSFLNSDPELASLFLHRLFELFIRRQSDMFNNPQKDFLNEQLRISKIKLAQSQKELEDFKSESKFTSIDAELEQLLKEKSDAQATSFEGMDTARQNLAALEAKKANLLTTYNASSPIVQQTQQNINVARAQLSARQNDLSVTPEGGIHHNPSPLTRHIQDIDNRLQELEAMRGKYNDLSRQTQIEEENYKNYSIHGEKARVNAMLNERRINRISVLDEPVTPRKTARPRKTLTLALSVLAGLLFGLGVSAGFETFDQRFSSPRQLKELSRLPVLATFYHASQKVRLA